MAHTEHCTQISFGSRISHVLMMIHKSLIFDQINMRIVKFMRFMIVIRVRRMSKGNEGFNVELLELLYRVLCVVTFDKRVAARGSTMRDIVWSVWRFVRK